VQVMWDLALAEDPGEVCFCLAIRRERPVLGSRDPSDGGCGHYHEAPRTCSLFTQLHKGHPLDPDDFNHAFIN
jgi:hypothetical protein